jgi:hypothetical protein
MVNNRSVNTVVDHSIPALTGCADYVHLWVLLYHAWAYATPQAITWVLFDTEIRVHVFFSLGWSGVQILFVLPAFLLTTPYHGLLAPNHRWRRWVTPARRGKALKTGANAEVRTSAECHPSRCLFLRRSSPCFHRSTSRNATERQVGLGSCVLQPGSGQKRSASELIPG